MAANAAYRSLEKAAVVGATGAGIGYAAEAAGLVPDLLWPSPAGQLLGNSNNTPTFFGVVNGVSSIAADIVEENILPAVVGDANLVSVLSNQATGPAIAAGAGYAYLMVMNPNVLKNPFVGVPGILGMIAAGEYIGRALHDRLSAQLS